MQEYNRSGIRTALVVAYPAGSPTVARIIDASRTVRWQGELSPGVNEIPDVRAAEVGENWSVSLDRDGGTTTFPLGRWHAHGVVVIPSEGCPSSP